MVRIVLDTNVLVSAVLTPKGAPGHIIEMIPEGIVRPCVSSRILAEYQEVLGRKKFGLSPSTVSAVITNLRFLSTEVVPVETLDECKDPADNMFLECAIAAGAAYLITGNQKHFPKVYRGVQIVSPSRFFKQVGR